MSTTHTTRTSTTKHIITEELTNKHKKALDTQTKTFNDIEKQFDDYNKTLDLTNITVKDIDTLQQLLTPLLDTIILSNDPNSFTIKPAKLDYESMPSGIPVNREIYNIFKIPSDRKELDKQKYGKFLIFMITESIKINKEFANANDTNDTNNVDILTVHLMDHISTEDYKAIQELKKKYETLYPKLKKQDKLMPLKSQFPDFYGDIINKKNKQKLYEDTETQYDFGDITTQNDLKIIGNLNKRIEGLKKCSEDLTEKKKTDNDTRIVYYEEEYKDESKTYEEVIKDTSLTDTEKIEKLCTNIKWGSKIFDYDKNKTKNNNASDLANFYDTEFDNFYKFITENPGELEFVKTFLPIECFNQDGQLLDNVTLKKILFDIASNPDTSNIHKQYIFGVRDDVLKFSKIHQFYNSYNMSMSKSKLKSTPKSKSTSHKSQDKLVTTVTDEIVYNCHPLVNWTIYLNMLYARCAINNSKIPFPIRFILPDSYIPYIIDPEDIYSEYTLSATTENTIFYDAYPTIFDISNTTDLEFIGFLNIKYFNKNKLHYNNKKMFIYKNNNRSNSFITNNEYDGFIHPYIILTRWFRYITYGSLQPKLAITYRELKDFIKYAKQGIVFIYLYNAPEYLDDLQTQKNPLYKKILFIRQTKLSDDDKTKYNVTLLTPENKALQLLTNLPSRILSMSKVPSSFRSSRKRLHGGNRTLVNSIHIKKSAYINLFDDKLSNGIYKEYYSLRLGKILLNNLILHITTLSIIHNCVSIVYKYILIMYNPGYIYTKIINDYNYFKKYLIVKYKPIYYNYYDYNEIFIKFNILKNITKNDNILIIGHEATPIEVLKNTNYKINNITYILYYNKDIYTSINIKYTTDYFENLKHIYNINFIYFKEKIEKLLDFDVENINNYALFTYTMYNMYERKVALFIYSDFYNVIHMFIGMMMCLKYTKINGIFIMKLGSVAYKQTADIYLILKEYFEESYLYYPELSNHFKDNNVIGIFKKFKGIYKSDYEKLMDILLKLLKLYPDNMHHTFNIYDKADREKYNITKPMDKTNRDKYITGFLPDNTDYSEIIAFNNIIYQTKLLFIQKLIHLLQDKDEAFKTIKLPTQDQIAGTILYCRKYNIPLIDKFTINKQETIIIKTILSDVYGLRESILYKFKTPFQTHILNTIIFNPKFEYTNFKSLSFKNNKSSSLVSRALLISKRVKNLTYKNKHKHTNKDTKPSTNVYKNVNHSFLNNRTTDNRNNNTHNKYTKKNTKKYISNLPKKISHKVLTYATMSLTDAIYQSNNSFNYVDQLMINSRANKHNAKDTPNEIYDKLKDELQNYKSSNGEHTNKNKSHNSDKLDIKVQLLLGDNSISQEWLKMYEIITDCNLIPINRKGVFTTFHICNPSSAFINCINNYIHTKTQYSSFEWKSQSVKPKGVHSKDTTMNGSNKLIQNYREKWDWGVDDTGDITNIENIKYYAKLTKQMNINLMTSANGLPMNNPKYAKVAYASYVSILYSLPINGSMLYKIHSPIDIPLIWNLIYITYTNFKEMYFFKPVQNAQTRELYIIAKGYIGIEQKILDKLLSFVDIFDIASDAQANSKTKTQKYTRNYNNADYDNDDNYDNYDNNDNNNDNNDNNDNDNNNKHKNLLNKESYDLFNDTYPEEFVIQVRKICETLSTNYVNSIERIIYYVDNIENLGDEYKKHIESYMTEKHDDWISEYKPKRLDEKFVL